MITHGYVFEISKYWVWIYLSNEVIFMNLHEITRDVGQGINFFRGWEPDLNRAGGFSWDIWLQNLLFMPWT